MENVVKNEASKKTILIGGPIQSAIDDAGNFDDNLKTAIMLITNAFIDAGFNVLSAHIVEQFGKNIPETSESIARRDYEWMARCDLYVAVFATNAQGEFIRSDGTHIEIGWACALHKPLILVGSGIPNKQNSHLVRGLSGISKVQFLELIDVISSPTLLITSAKLSMQDGMSTST